MVQLCKTYLILFGSLILFFKAGAKTERTEPHPHKKPHVVFLISEDADNYEAHLTVPVFADRLESELGYKVTVIQAQGERNSSNFPGIEILNQADLVVLFARRLALPKEQLNLLKKFLAEGNPLVGIRTANHAFAVLEGSIPSSHRDWQEFVPEILGCENRGYGPVEPGTYVTIVPEAKDHAILNGITTPQWHSEGNVYLVAPLLDKQAEVLLTGSVGDKTQPIAWTRKAGKSKVFYTSLGYPKDFEAPQFRLLLTNAIQWALEK